MKPISVLHISTADNAGGSGRSAYKIHRGLRDAGLTSRMLVRHQVTEDPDVGPINPGWLRQADRLANNLTHPLGLQYLYFPSSARLRSHPWYREADVIQLYNTHGKYFSIRGLPRMSREKVVVWRLSDMWPMTGHCAYCGPCEKWKTGCQGCPDLKAYPSLKRDTAGWLWRWKQQLYQQSRIHVVAPSSWIHGLAGESPLLRGFPRSIIRNGIDCQIFRPRDQETCRRELKIPHRGQGILFLAHFVTDVRKGIDTFATAVRQLWNSGRRDFFAMIVGAGADQWAGELPCPIWRHDEIKCDDRLSLVYNSSDVIVHPAVVENLPNSLLEAFACGIPAVGFDAGGVAEVVVHQQTGFLANFGNTNQLTEGLDWVLADRAASPASSRRCRQMVLDEYSLTGQATRFAQLYEGLLDRAVPMVAPSRAA